MRRNALFFLLLVGYTNVRLPVQGVMTIGVGYYKTRVTVCLI